MTTYTLRHTPRPWVLCSSFDWRRHDACAPMRAIGVPRTGAIVAYANCGWPAAEQRANARLAAAAPDVLRHLHAIVTKCDLYARGVIRHVGGVRRPKLIHTKRAQAAQMTLRVHHKFRTPLPTRRRPEALYGRLLRL